jgi:hypothetical protein
MLVAGSGGGWLLGLSALGAFLLHQPLKITIKDRLKGRRPPRAVLAERVAVGYGLLATVPFTALLGSNADPAFLLPLALAVPLVIVQLVYDARNQSRALLSELAGSLALGAIAPTIALLGGWTLPDALLLWVILAARTIPSILYIRARLKLEHDKPISPAPAWAAHGVALFGLTVLALVGVVPYLSAVAMLLLGVRALFGLSRFRKPRRAPIIGAMEICYGVLTVILTALGYGRGW